MDDTLGPRLARKPLHLFWILDTSGSMGAAGKVEALNTALRDAVPALRDTVADNPGVELLVRVVTFDDDARWHVVEPVPIEQFEWHDVAATPRGTTEVGRAIDLVTAQIRTLAAARRGMPPALVLVSDGRPTDLKQPTFGSALRALSAETWGRKASRMAIGVGADADMDALARFIGHDEIRPVRATNAAELAHYLRWASTVAVGELTRTGGAWDEDAADVTGRPDEALAPPNLASSVPTAGRPVGPAFDLPPPDLPPPDPPPSAAEPARPLTAPPPLPVDADDATW